MPEIKYTITFEDETCKGCPILSIDNGYLVCEALRIGRDIGFGSWVNGNIRIDQIEARPEKCPLLNPPRQVNPCYKEGRKTVHPNAVEVGEQEDGYPGGDIITKKCPDCGKRWKEELPQ